MGLLGAPTALTLRGEHRDISMESSHLEPPSPKNGKFIVKYGQADHTTRSKLQVPGVCHQVLSSEW